ncbi:DNA (cytosine-5-)-methyltransferase [Ligilactobacillus saerimneri]|uniref:DNA (cytosine-5-)-methyltransferase n=1 Tax=Ligilactobacillus saerimneri TaxID=228229 RepID=UPI0022A7D369|nr:DNA (cytosine-5-)-methyltransferase [Ligilactobacillus saerimneri]MCZ0890977.1 DNA (cytosine-5-)-methyltransferase [Ligilactobacillus saerimneri]
MKSKTLKIADLFAGMGGIRIGFEEALKKKNLKAETVFVSEIKKSAISVYKDNFDTKQITGDITKVNTEDIPDLDYVLAGFPCQAFSNAGKRLGFEDARGTLFFDVARIIKDKQPKGFLLENVEGLTTHDHGKTFKVIINTLRELGYQVSYRVLDSANFGLAQSRKRIYIAGTKNGRKPDLSKFKQFEPAVLGDIIDTSVKPVQDSFSQKLLGHYSLSEVEGKQIKDKRGGKNNIHSWDFNLKGKVSKEQKELLGLMLKQRRNKKWAPIWGIDWMDGMPLTISMIKTFYDRPNLQEMLSDLVSKGYLVYENPKKKTSHGREYDTTKPKGYNIVTGKLSFKYSKILSTKDTTPTLVATDVSHLGIPVNGGLRKLTPREGLRLFGYPENYSLDSVTTPKAFDLLGNTVAVNVIEQVSEKLLEANEVYKD